MNDPLTVSALAGCVWRDFMRSRRALFVYEVLFKLATVWVVAPVVAVLLAAILATAGHVAVSNLDILDFLVTPTGLIYAALVGTFATALLLFEQAGVMVLVAVDRTVERPPLKEMLGDAFRKSLRIVQLGAIQAR